MFLFAFVLFFLLLLVVFLCLFVLFFAVLFVFFGVVVFVFLLSSALLIFFARGGFVVVFVLVVVFCVGWFGGVGVDVLTTEPPREGQVLREPDFPHLIVTPHFAWASREARQRLVHEVAANVTAFSQGTPRNVVR